MSAMRRVTDSTLLRKFNNVSAAAVYQECAHHHDGLREKTLSCKPPAAGLRLIDKGASDPRGHLVTVGGEGRGH